jgi:16S rRNA C1402 (ribose-2'-O) methylase RsmI
MKAYQTYKHKDRVARILTLSNMRNNIILYFEKHRLTQSVWDIINIEYGRTSTTRLHQLTLKFDGH